MKKFIAEKGLKKHLDSTADAHNGNGYNEFVQYVQMLSRRNEPLRVTPTGIGRVFGVDYRTIVSWIAIYEKERKANPVTARGKPQ